MIYVMFYHHWDDPVRRELTVSTIRAVTNSYERHGVRAHYGFVGVVLQQLLEDAPDVVAQLKRLRMPIGYHGGAGHNPDGPVGHPRDARAMAWDDAVRAFWAFETHALTKDARETVPDRMGGYLAIQSVLGVIPLPTDAKGAGRVDVPGEFVLTRMGAGSYPVTAPYGPDAIILSPLHEPQLFADVGRGVPPTYLGKAFGVDAPRTASPDAWFAALAANLPEDGEYVVHCMTHAGLNLEALDRLLAFLASHPDDFCVTHPDPESKQWLPENGPQAFYQRTYGIETLDELMVLTEPPAPLPISVTAREVALAAASVLNTHQFNTHDGDFGEPPEVLDLGHRRLTLAQGFQALATSLAHWAKHGDLPGSLSLPFIHGPTGYPQYGREVRPKFPTREIIGYTPTELPIQETPEPTVVNRQGLPPSGEYHIWMPTHSLVDGQQVIDAAAELDLSERVPGVIEVTAPTEDSRGQEPRLVAVALNPAEFLHACAQIYRRLAQGKTPGAAALVSTKVIAQERTECVLLRPGGPRDSFIWRSPLSPVELDTAWTTVPAGDREQIERMSLPPLGDKVKGRMGRLLGEWQRKKQ